MGPEVPLRATAQQAQVVRMVRVVLLGQQGPAAHRVPMVRLVLTAPPVKLHSSSFPHPFSFSSFLSFFSFLLRRFLPPSTPLSPVFLPCLFAILALPCTNVEDTHETLAVG